MKVYVYRIEYNGRVTNRDYMVWVRHSWYNLYKSFYTDKFPRKKFSKKFCILRTYLQASERLILIGNKSITVNGFKYTLVAEYELP